MKKLLTISMLILLAACGEKESETTEQNILENLTYSIDTVVVDAGEEIINLNYGMHFSSLSPDRRHLYKFDDKAMQLQEVDLDQLKLTASYPFEKEGPNGVGAYGRNNIPLSDGNFLFVGSRKIGAFSKSGELKPDFDYAVDKLISGERPAQNMLSQFVYMEDKQRGFFLETAFDAPVYNLVSIDFGREDSKVLDLPEMDRTDDYSILTEENGYKIKRTQQVTLQAIDSKVYISTAVLSGIYRYDPELDSLEFINFPLQLTATEKTKQIKNKVSSSEESQTQYDLILSEIGFKEPLWDDQSNRFYRLSAILTPAANPDEAPKNKVYLSAFDADLNLIGEKFLEDLTAIPEFPFFKDGKLWTYVNVEDELGFAVFTFDF